MAATWRSDFGRHLLGGVVWGLGLRTPESGLRSPISDSGVRNRTPEPPDLANFQPPPPSRTNSTIVPLIGWFRPENLQLRRWFRTTLPRRISALEPSRSFRMVPDGSGWFRTTPPKRISPLGPSRWFRMVPDGSGPHLLSGLHLLGPPDGSGWFRMVPDGSGPPLLGGFHLLGPPHGSG